MIFPSIQTSTSSNLPAAFLPSRHQHFLNQRKLFDFLFKHIVRSNSKLIGRICQISHEIYECSSYINSSSSKTSRCKSSIKFSINSFQPGTGNSITITSIKVFPPDSLRTEISKESAYRIDYSPHSTVNFTKTTFCTSSIHIQVDIVLLIKNYSIVKNHLVSASGNLTKGN